MPEFLAIALLSGTDPTPWPMLSRAYLGHLFMESTRYLGVAGLVWLLLHVLLRQRLAPRFIAGWPTGRDTRRELGYSLCTLTVFAALGMAVVAGLMSGQMVIYRDPAKHGWAWLLASLPLMILWHDFYFYFTHRTLHTPWLAGRALHRHHAPPPVP